MATDYFDPHEVKLRAALLADLQLLWNATPGGITRNYYRENGEYQESVWQRHFPRFSDFIEAAGLAPRQPEQPEVDETEGDQRTITLPKTRIQTLQELLDYCRVDTATWEVERFTVNKWEMAALPKGTAEAVVTPLFQVKAVLKKKLQVVAIQREIEALKEVAKRSAPAGRPYVHSVVSSGNMLEINIPDLHVGKLSWAKETGHDYTTEAAQNVFLRAVETILDRTKGYTFEQILLVVGNDILQADDAENRTTRGTYVDVDGRYYKNFGVVRDTIISTVERLRAVAPVKVLMVRGNHDTLSVWHLGDSLECYFHRFADVEIDNHPVERKYVHFGQVLLMLTHGDKGKRGEYPLLMATEQPQLFGATKFREAHTGHTHQTKLDEQYGVRVRVLPALCPPDEWHSSNGYVGNQRNAEGYVWNKTEGLIAQVFHNEDAFSKAA